MISPGYGQSARAMLFKSVPTGERFSQKRWILRLTWNQWHNDFGTLRGNLINLLIISDKIRYKRSSTAPVRIDNSFHDLLHPLPPFLFQNRTIFPTFRVILDPLEAGGQSIHGALHFFLQKIERSFHVSINSRSTNRDLAQGSFPSGWSETRDTLSRYGQRENENEGTRLHTTTRLAIDFWLPNKFCPPVSTKHGARSNSAVQKSRRTEETFPWLARPIDYALIDYVTRDFVVGGINRAS